MKDQIVTPEPLLGTIDEGQVEFLARFENSGNVDENGLTIRLRPNCAQAVPRRLGAGRNDRDFLSDQVIDERAFPDIGRARKPDESRTTRAMDQVTRGRARRGRRFGGMWFFDHHDYRAFSSRCSSRSIGFLSAARM